MLYLGNWESIAKLARWVIAVINDMMEKQKETKSHIGTFITLLGKIKKSNFGHIECKSQYGTWYWE